MHDSVNAHQQLSKHRIEALIDGIFAVAMTLLVIDLRLPEHSRGLGETELRHALLELLPNFQSWVISFVVLAIFWIANHRLYNQVRHADTRLVWYTILMLGAASLLPFASAVNSQSLTVVGQAVYAAVMITMGLALLLMTRHLYRSPALFAQPMDRQAYLAACTRAAVVIAVAALTVPLAYVGPGMSNIAFGLLFGVRPLSEAIARRAAAHAPAVQEQEAA